GPSPGASRRPLPQKERCACRLQPLPGSRVAPPATRRTGMASLDGKVALVTGAGSGIGKATALALAREGAALIVMSRTQAEVEATAAEIEQAGGRAWAATADVTDDAAMKKLVAGGIERFGRLVA